MNKNEDLLIENMIRVSEALAAIGRDFNKLLVEQFKKNWNRSIVTSVAKSFSIDKERQIFYQAIAETLGWFQGVSKDEDKLKAREELPLCYFRILMASGNKPGKHTREQIESMLKSMLDQLKVPKPRRYDGIIAGLQTWTNVRLPDLKGKSLEDDITLIQKLALDYNRKIRWTTLAPLKMYALIRGNEVSKMQGIIPPVGSAVSRGINKIFGITIGESTKDYMLAKGFHARLADYAKSSIWDINSGFYKLGENKRNKKYFKG